MKALLAAGLLLLAARPLPAASPCLYPTTIRGTAIGCGSSSTCVATGGAQLTYPQIEQNVLNGDALCRWAGALSSGTVTSVGLSAPAGFSVTGSPITGFGTLALSFAPWAAGIVLAGPVSGADATPTRRAITLSDLAGALAGYNAPTATLAATATFATTAGSAPPSGAAGNGLAGSYPSPSIASPAAIDILGNATTATTASGPAASTLAPGLVRLSVDGGTTAGRVVQGNDSRLPPAIAAANLVLASPSGGAGAMSPRALAALDIPSALTSSTSGNAATCSALDHTPAACTSGKFASALAADGTLTCGTPAAGGGGPAVVAPLDPAECRAWINPTQSAPQSSTGSDTVQLYSLEGRAAHFTDIGSPSNRPTFVPASSPTGRAAVQFSGSGTQLVGPASTSVMSASAFAGVAALKVTSVTLGGPGIAVYTWHGVVTHSAAYYGLYVGDAATPKACAYLFDSVGEKDACQLLSLDAWHVVAWRHNAGNLCISIDQAVETCVAAADVADTSGTVKLGGNPTTCTTCIIAGVALYNPVPSQLADVVTWFRAYYGI